MAKNRLPIQFDDLRLTDKEQEFLLLYATNGYDAITAYKEAKLSRKSDSAIEIRLSANALLNKREIKIGVQRFTESVIGPYRDHLETLLLESDKARAFYDIADYFYDNGDPKPLSSLTREQRIVIDGVTTDYKGKDANVKVVTMKIADRNVAMKNLRTMLKIAEDGEAGKQEIPDSARTRVSEIFKAGLMGIKEGEKKARAELKRATVPSESVEVEFVEEDGEDTPVEPLYVATVRQEVIQEEVMDKAVEESPVMKKAKNILSGMNLPADHPILMKGKAIAEAKIREKQEKDNK